jgi:AcrR family transcriptional regulator
VTTTRRERLRRETLRDIKAVALDHLRDHGPADLSLRAVARDLGMSAPGLYRYFDGRDELLTALIADGFHDLANHLHAATGTDDHVDVGRPAPAPPERTAADAPPRDRLQAAALAYRAWGISRPQEFGLLFGAPVPGYAAPAGGPTVVAMGRVGAAFLGPLVEAALAGRLRPHDRSHLSAATRTSLAGMYGELPRDVPVEAVSAMLGAWGHVHGLVCLEAFGHWHWLLADAEDIHRAELAAMIGDLGLT